MKAVFYYGLVVVGTVVTAVGCGGAGGPLGGSTGNFGSVSYDIVGTAQAPVNRYSTTVAFSGISGATFSNYIYRDFASQPIIYAGLEGGSSQFYGMSTTSGQRTTFSDTAGISLINPEPATDGSVIYGSTFTGGSWFIVSISFDTGNINQFNPSGANYRDMGVSPKGDIYAYSSDVDGNYEIYWQAFVAGSPVKVSITSPGVVNSDPCISADGRNLYYVSNRDGNNEIYRYSFVSGSTFRLTNNTGDDVEPAVSPNGQHVVWSTNRDGNYEIYRMVAENGSTATRLTSNVYSDREPTYSLDGTKVFFASDRDDTAPPVSMEVYSMTTTGGSPTRIAIDSSYDQKSPKQAPVLRFNYSNMGFPTGTAGYIAGLNNSALQSLLTFKIDDPTDANNGQCRIESDTQPSIAVPVIFYTITSPVPLAEIAFTNPSVTFRPTVTKILPTLSVEALVAFSASGPRAGQVLYVAPYNANRSRLTRKAEGGTATAEGSFTAVYDSTGNNIAPNGASKVVTDGSGQIHVSN